LKKKKIPEINKKVKTPNTKRKGTEMESIEKYKRSIIQARIEERRISVKANIESSRLPSELKTLLIDNLVIDKFGNILIEVPGYRTVFCVEDGNRFQIHYSNSLGLSASYKAFYTIEDVGCPVDIERIDSVLAEKHTGIMGWLFS